MRGRFALHPDRTAQTLARRLRRRARRARREGVGPVMTRRLHEFPAPIQRLPARHSGIARAAGRAQGFSRWPMRNQYQHSAQSPAEAAAQTPSPIQGELSETPRIAYRAPSIR